MNKATIARIEMSIAMLGWLATNGTNVHEYGTV